MDNGGSQGEIEGRKGGKRSRKARKTTKYTEKKEKSHFEKFQLDLINNARQTARELSVRAFLDQFAFCSLFNTMMGLII